MSEERQQGPIAIAIHGGAGAIPRNEMTPEREKAYKAALDRALSAGHKVLADGGTSLDAVQAAILVLEDDPLYNAGRGAVFTADRRHELDASIMEGKTLKAGAVAGVHHVKNPILLARAIMDDSPHVMMVSAGAEAFARQHHLEMVDTEYFSTPEKLQDLLKAQQKEQDKEKRSDSTPDRQFKWGTVGCVALDRAGNLAAGTSTGGMTNKRYGRVGDSPIIGAGTYANNHTCAVSCTGHGEYFIRAVVAHDISTLMDYKGLSVGDAADLVVKKKLVAMGGEGGVICVDRQGRIAFSYNTPGMFRGSVDTQGKKTIAIYDE
ncbi:MAG TPA: isoaspartyl peptidase/L-asparaginase [Planctomycetaceae bacterium]|nr:isoaspartyl peptidase/L-asparaginase [Planctomycetaceae bacterium]